MPPSSTLTNQPGFVFDFFVATGDIVETADLFFNLVFGDYDVSPALIRLTSADNSTQDLSVALQGSADGLIQEASVTLSFDDVFTAAPGGWNGYLEVDFIANSEPYTAFDYVELSVVNDPGSVVVSAPESGSTLSLLALVGLSLSGVRVVRRSRDTV